MTTMVTMVMMIRVTTTKTMTMSMLSMTVENNDDDDDDDGDDDSDSIVNPLNYFSTIKICDVIYDCFDFNLLRCLSFLFASFLSSIHEQWFSINGYL